MYFLREVVSIWGFLPIYILSYITPELKGVSVFRVFFTGWIFLLLLGFLLCSTAKGVEKSSLLPRQHEKLLMLITNIQPLSQLICECGNMDIEQPGGLAAAQIPASMPPHKPSPPHSGLGNGFHRCAAIFQLRSLNRLLIAI